MPQVSIVMGSDSDMSVMSKAAEMLDRFGITYEMKIISAHREPDIFFEYARTAEDRGIRVIIAGAGMAAHLPGMCAALFPLRGGRSWSMTGFVSILTEVPAVFFSSALTIRPVNRANS